MLYIRRLMEELETPHFFDLSSFAHAKVFEGCRFPWEVLEKIESYLKTLSLGQIEVDIPEGAYLLHPELISIGKGSVVEPGSTIIGPCVIGKECQVRQGAYIRGSFIAGDRCVIGHTTEVKNAIFLNQAVAGHFAYVGDSVLGNQVNLGAGTKLANLKMSLEKVAFAYQESYVQTGLRKMGAIIGDRVQVGCNAVTNPGTLVGPDSYWYPCVNAGGVIPPRSIVKPETRAVVVTR